MASRISHRSPGLLAGLLVGGLLAALLAAAPAQAQDAGGEALAIIKQDELPSNAELAVRLSEETPFADVARVVISRDDEFADALASGLMQSDAPLLLVPPQGPVPARVLDEIRRLGVTTATILGGTAAVSPQVEQELAAAGVSIERREGGSRYETAIAIARAEAPDADTVILARAGSSDPVNNPTQGFADALAAGAMAADERWPILLSDTGSLTPITRDYLSGSPVQRVMIVGGTAAISTQVEQELQALGLGTERIAGDSRAETAVEVAKARGADSAADVGRVVLVDGTSPDGFAGGFAAAAHAAFYDAPILLADGVRLPPETQAFLEPGAAFAQTPDALDVTCVVHPLACDGGREALGLVDFPLLEVFPAINSLVAPGQTVELQLGPADEGAGVPVTVKGSCLDGEVDLVTDGSGRAAFALSSGIGSEDFCSVEILYGTDTDTVQQGFSYTTNPEFARGEGIDIASDVYSYGTTITDTPIYLTDTISCTGPAGDITQQSSAYEARYLHPDFFSESFALTSVPLTALPGDTCTASVLPPDGVGRILWGLYSWSDSGLRNPLLIGSGTTATFSFDDLGTEVTDVDIVWIVETNDPTIGTPPPPGEGTPGRVFNPEGLPVVCDGVEVGRGFSAPGPGASCSVASEFAGLDVLVVAPGRPLVPAPSTTFTLPGSSEVVGVYTVNTSRGESGGSCATAPELDYSFITPGFTTPAQPAAYHLFYGFQGEAIRFRADNAYGDFEFGIDPILTVFGPDGQVIGSNDDGDSGLNSRVDAVLPAEGFYCLEVTGYGTSAGDYFVIADPAPTIVDSGTLAPGTTATVPLDLNAGDVAILEMRAPGFELTDPLMSVLGPDGQEVAFSDDDGGFPNARIELEAATSGRYTVVLDTYDGSGGPYLFEGAVIVGQAFASARELPPRT
jgi:putative cell wall-binding protein